MRESMLNIRGERYQFLKVGRGRRKLVLIHGLAASKEAMLDYAKPLTKSFSCLILDLPGHNGLGMCGINDLDSYATYVKRLIERLGWKRFGIVGFSFGSFVGLRLAEMYRKEGKRLPAVAWAGSVRRDIAMVPRYFSRFISLMGLLPRWFYRWLTGLRVVRWLSAAVGIRPGVSGWRAIEDFDNSSVGIMAGIISDGLGLEEGVEKLIVLGDNDVLVTPNLKFLESKPHIKKTRIVVIKQGGHFGTKKGVARAIKEISGFFSRFLL